MPVELQLVSSDALGTDADLLAIPLLQGTVEKQKLVTALDAKLGGGLLALIKKAEFSGKYEQSLEIPTLGRVGPGRVLLYGLGQKRDLAEARLRAAISAMARTATATGVKHLAIALPDGGGGNLLRAVAEGAVLGAYRFTKYFTGDRQPKESLELVSLFRPGPRPTATERRALELGRAVGDAVCLARDAVNEPPNELYPEKLAEMARELARAAKLKIQVLDKQGLADAGMKLHYAVGQGSAHEPRLIHMTYAPKGAKRRIVFVGKGLTFDSGGLCIKPAPGMGEMKSDMGGAAAVLGLMQAIAAVRPNVEVHGIIGAAENMPDGAAYRPGDVFGSLDGKTVEIINTDAEGRLVLADALTYAVRLEPELIVDAATLTGACIVALGKTCSGYYATNDKLAAQLEAAAREAGEAFWRLPLLDELKDQLKSDIADLKHTGERWGGSITAALFLQEFVAGVPWIHCDVAGPVLADRAKGIYPKGGTGHPVLTFLRFVENLR
jgi:leucyl aminopeptidase